MQIIVDTLVKDFSDVNFTSGTTFMWSPQENTIQYDASAILKKQGLWSLLHELGHAQLEHASYTDDLELLIMEVSAWKQAQIIGKTYEISIQTQYIDDCLETYRSWLHKRSRCVECGIHSFQLNHTTYQCHNCHTKWHVSASRLCKIRKKRIY